MEWNEVILADLKFEEDRDKEYSDRCSKYHSRRYRAWSESSSDETETPAEKITANPNFLVIERNDVSILAEVPAKSLSCARLYRLVREKKDWQIDAIYTPCSCELDNDDATRRSCSSCHGKGACPSCKGTGKDLYSYDSRQTVCKRCNGTGICKYCNGAKQCPYCSNSDIPGWKDPSRCQPENDKAKPSQSDARPMRTNTRKLPDSLSADASTPDWMEPLIVSKSYSSSYVLPRKRAALHTKRYTALLNRLREAKSDLNVMLVEQTDSRVLAALVDLDEEPGSRLSRTRYEPVREDGHWLLDSFLFPCSCSLFPTRPSANAHSARAPAYAGCAKVRENSGISSACFRTTVRPAATPGSARNAKATVNVGTAATASVPVGGKAPKPIGNPGNLIIGAIEVATRRACNPQKQSFPSATISLRSRRVRNGKIQSLRFRRHSSDAYRRR